MSKILRFICILVMFIPTMIGLILGNIIALILWTDQEKLRKGIL